MLLLCELHRHQRSLCIDPETLSEALFNRKLTFSSVCFAASEWITNRLKGEVFKLVLKEFKVKGDAAAYQVINV